MVKFREQMIHYRSKRRHFLAQIKSFECTVIMVPNISVKV